MPPDIFRGPDLALVDEEEEEEAERKAGEGVVGAVVDPEVAVDNKAELTQNLRNLLKLG